jgi:hypothetical protein
VSAGVREPTRVVSVPTAAIKPTLGFWSGPDHAGDGAGDITYVRTWAGFAYTAFVTHPALWRRIVAWERNLLDPVGCGSSATATSVRRSRPHGHRPPEAHRHTSPGPASAHCTVTNAISAARGTGPLIAVRGLSRVQSGARVSTLLADSGRLRCSIAEVPL